LDRLHLIKVFIAVVDANGFAGAARALRISPPAVTRAINALETQLGVQLLMRTTRVVRLTEPGARYAEDYRRILAEMELADETVAGLHGSPRGVLSVTAPVLFGARFVTPVVTDYLRQYPDMRVSCWFLGRLVNLLEEGLDVAVRIADLPNSSTHAVRVGQVRRVICAAPAYLQQRGIPQTPDDLQQHCIISAQAGATVAEWRLMDAGAVRVVKVLPRLSTNGNESAIAAAVSGFGITRVLSYQIAEQLRNGRLKVVLAEFEPAALPVHVMHREGRHPSQKVQTFLDFAIERLRAHPSLN